jgi:autotransporter-associated beta strand protein
VVIAGNTWLNPFILSVREPADWLSTFYSIPAPPADAALVAEARNSRSADLSMARMLNGLLFFHPKASTSWRLDSAPDESSLRSLRHQESGAFADQPAYESPSSTFFSASFVGYSAASQILPTDPNGGPPPPPGYWTANASGNWSNASNWKDGVIANGATAQAHFDTLDITADVTVTVDSSRLIGDVYVGDTNGTHHYNIAPGTSGQTLVFDNLGATTPSILQQSSTSAGDTISVPLRLRHDLTVINSSTTAPLSITGGIASNATAGTLQNLNFNGGEVLISGDITDGSTGARIRVHVNAGTLNVSGTNTYSGTTFVEGGTLFVKGDNSDATGIVQVSGAGSVLSGIGTIGGAVNMSGGTITGGDTTHVGRLTLTQDLNLFGGEGGTPTYLANLEDDLSDLLAITGTLRLGTGTTLNIQGIADGTTTYTLATFSSITGVFDNVLNLPQGYEVFYLPNELVLAPIPEPATWVGGTLALGTMALMRARKKLKSKILKR